MMVGIGDATPIQAYPVTASSTPAIIPTPVDPGVGVQIVQNAIGSTPQFILTGDGTVFILQSGGYVPVGLLTRDQAQSIGGTFTPVQGGAISSLTADQIHAALQFIISNPVSARGAGYAAAISQQSANSQPGTAQSDTGSSSLISGIPNSYLAIGAGAAILLLMVGRR